MDIERRTIFIVDDDPTNLTTGSNALEAYYDVMTLDSGPRLLSVLERAQPDLILLDVAMPGMDGYEVIKKIKADPKTRDIPIIFLTARDSEHNEMEGLSLGAMDYITKPFRPPLLRKRMEMQLQLVDRTRELTYLNTHLQEIVDAKTEAVVGLKNTILRTMGELVEYRDDITGGHIMRTQQYLKLMIDELKDQGLYKREIDAWDLELVLHSAQLHDVGKIAIHDSILKKPDKLTPEEFEYIKGHTTQGVEIIERIRQGAIEQTFLDYAKIFAGTHHEKWNGSGYPNGLIGEEIPLLGRLMAIADVYDALVSDRPYKKAFPHDTAVSIINEGSGTHFDPVLVDVFLRVQEAFKKFKEEA